MIINYIYPLLLTEFIILLAALHFTKMDYTSPSVITSGMFLLSGLCALWNVENWEISFNSTTYLVVTSVLIVMLTTEFFMYSVFRNKTRWKDVEIVKVEPPIYVYKIVVLLMCLVSTLLMLIYVREVRTLGGKGLSAIATVKMDEKLNVSFLAKMALRVIRVFPYPCMFIIVHNVVLCGQKIKKNIGLIVPILMATIVIFFSGSRAPYVYIMLSAYVYIVMFERYKNGWRNIDIKKYIKPLIITVVGFIVLFVGTRSLVKGHEFTSNVVEYVTFYFGSPIHLLNKIINNIEKGFSTPYTLFGANTFASFYEELYKFGLVKESIHLNQTAFIAVGGNFVGGGNVFTFIGSPLNDFGVFGLLIYTACFYGVIDAFYYRKIKNNIYIRKNYIQLLLYGYFFYLIFMTFYVTTTVYLKMQTLLEAIIMIATYEIMIKLKISMGRIK